MNEFQKAIGLTDSLEDRARGAALGVVSLKNERGDYGLLDDLADRIAELEGLHNVMTSQLAEAQAARDMVMSSFVTNIESTIRSVVESWAKDNSHADTHARQIWANVEIAGDGKPLAGEWNHTDVGSPDDAVFIRKDVMDVIVSALSGRSEILAPEVATIQVSDTEKTLLLHYLAMRRERDAALRREASLKDSTQDLRDLRREHNSLRNDYISLKNADAIKGMFLDFPQLDMDSDSYRP